jgi:enamine deaminase RidA (YjgF/YER057c/UK114 family)
LLLKLLRRVKMEKLLAGKTTFLIRKIEKALQQTGAILKDVVATRIFVKNIEQGEIIGKAPGRFFKEIRPATTMVEVSNLIEPEMLLEIEMQAAVNG